MTLTRILSLSLSRRSHHARAIISIISRPFDAGPPLVLFAPTADVRPPRSFDSAASSLARTLARARARALPRFCHGITYTTRSKFFTRSRPSPKIEINFTQCVRASPRAYLNIAKLYHIWNLASSSVSLALSLVFLSLFVPSAPSSFTFLRGGSLLVNLGLLAKWRGTDVYTCIYTFFFLSPRY